MLLSNFYLSVNSGTFYVTVRFASPVTWQKGIELGLIKQKSPYNRILCNSERNAYLYYCRTDGIGFQYRMLSALLSIANDLKLSILVDWRKLSYFESNNQSFSVDRLHKYFRILHPRLIYDPVEIDRIITQYPERVTGIKPGPHFGCPDKIASRLETVLASELYAEFGKKIDCLSSYLELQGQCGEKFNRFRKFATHAIGVHARLGNGEVMKNPMMRRRVDIEYERFFREMDRHEGSNFLVCTDTPSFLEACRDRYGIRLISMPRNMAPQDSGTGHKNGKKATLAQLDGYEQLGDALVEMLLLGECEQLICNASCFSIHARVCKQVKTSILANDIDSYSLVEPGDLILD